MLTRKSKICCSVDKKGACVYMCYIWFCSVINFVWKKCKKFNVIQEKVKMANWIFDRALLLYRSSNGIQHFNVAIVLLTLLLCINHCHGKNYRFLFSGKYAMYKDSSKLNYGWFRKFSYDDFIWWDIQYVIINNCIHKTKWYLQIERFGSNY